MIIYLDRKLLSCSSGNNPEGQRATSTLPYSALLQMGFTKPASYLTAGALLPHLSTLTACAAVSFSMALSLGSPPPDVIRHPALRSPDFPHLLPFGNCSRDYPHYSISLILIILIFCSFKYHSEYLYTKFVFRSYSDKTASIHNLTILFWLLSYYFNNNIKNLMVRHLN